MKTYARFRERLATAVPTRPAGSACRLRETDFCAGDAKGLRGRWEGWRRARDGAPSARLAGGDWREWEEPWWVTWLGCLAAAALLALSLLLI